MSSELREILLLRSFNGMSGGRLTNSKYWGLHKITVSVDIFKCRMDRPIISSCVVVEKVEGRAESCNFPTDRCKFTTEKLVLKASRNSHIACVEKIICLHKVVRSMIGLYDIRSLVVKRRSRLLANLDCVSLFQNYSVLHFCICSLF